MDDILFTHYVREISRQAAFSESGMRALRAAVSGGGLGVVLTAFAAAQSVLTAGAQVSKLLSPQYQPDWSPERRDFTKDRARRLRKIVNPDPILDQRKVRNAVEHFDERLDNYVFSGGHMIIDSNVAPRHAINAPGAKYLRNLDPETLTFSVLDDEVDLEHLNAALQAAGAAADLWADQRLFG